MPSLCLEPLAGWHPEAPRCQLPEAHQLPAGHLGAGQALLSFQKHWPTHLRLGLESQSRVSQECPSQPAPILRPGDENKLLSLALLSCRHWVGCVCWEGGSPDGIWWHPTDTPPNPSPAGNALSKMAHACCSVSKLNSHAPTRSAGVGCGWGQGQERGSPAGAQG